VQTVLETLVAHTVNYGFRRVTCLLTYEYPTWG